MINMKMIYRIMGILILLEAAILLSCIGVSLLYAEDDLNSFIVTVIITTIAGGILALLGKGAERHLGKRDGIIIVSLSWIVISVFGMLPFYISGYIPNIVDAFFETMSGFTSTGASILNDVESLPHGLLFWRSLTQWFGGLGIVFFTIAVLPIFGVGSIQLFAAETSGLNQDKVHPRIGVAAKWIWSIYFGLTLFVVALLTAGGMPVFDSICHAFATTGTGGFSTKQASIAFYNSPYVEYVIAIFMTISGVNFTLLLFFVNGRFKKFFGNTELKWYLASVVLFTLFITGGLCHMHSIGVEEAFRKAFFQVASLHTSTGFVTTDYMSWEPVLWSTLCMLMVIGACAGSTSGGMKCIRMVILTKVAQNEFKRIIHPNAVLPVKVNKQIIPPSALTNSLSFIFVYLAIVTISSLIMMSMGVDFIESVGSVVSCVGNAGPGLGLTGSTYSWSSLPDGAKWLSSFLMLVGRLELFTVLILFTREFWKVS